METLVIIMIMAIFRLCSLCSEMQSLCDNLHKPLWPVQLKTYTNFKQGIIIHHIFFKDISYLPFCPQKLFYTCVIHYCYDLLVFGPSLLKVMITNYEFS